MLKWIRKVMAFVLCGIGLILPWKLRCIYIEILGWITQFIHLTYIVILKFIIKELEKAKMEKAQHENQ